MSILAHPAWPWLREHIEIEKVAGDRDRIRIEVVVETSIDRNFALGITMNCVNCGRKIHAVRARKSGRSNDNHNGKLFFAASCELTHNRGCARSKAPRLEYNAIRRDVRPDLAR